MLDSHAGDPGSNLTGSPTPSITLWNFLKVALFARPISKSFLKSPGQELSEYIVLSSGKSFFASLDFGQVWVSSNKHLLT